MECELCKKREGTRIYRDCENEEHYVCFLCSDKLQWQIAKALYA